MLAMSASDVTRARVYAERAWAAGIEIEDDRREPLALPSRVRAAPPRFAFQSKRSMAPAQNARQPVTTMHQMSALYAFIGAR